METMACLSQFSCVNIRFLKKIDSTSIRYIFKVLTLVTQCHDSSIQCPYKVHNIVISTKFIHHIARNCILALL